MIIKRVFKLHEGILSDCTKTIALRLIQYGLQCLRYLESKKPRYLLKVAMIQISTKQARLRIAERRFRKLAVQRARAISVSTSWAP